MDAIAKTDIAKMRQTGEITKRIVAISEHASHIPAVDKPSRIKMLFVFCPEMSESSRSFNTNIKLIILSRFIINLRVCRKLSNTRLLPNVLLNNDVIGRKNFSIFSKSWDKNIFFFLNYRCYTSCTKISP